MQFLKKKICLGIFMNDDRISDDFNVVVSSFKRLRSGTENARLPRLSLVLETESCCEVQDLSCLEVFHRCMSLMCCKSERCNSLNMLQQ